MKYKLITLRESGVASVATEIMFEVAAAHARNLELLRIDINKTNDIKAYDKVFSSVVRLLKKMKETGSIQFFATAQSFVASNTEAKFLLNKYPEIFEIIPEETEKNGFVYIRV